MHYESDIREPLIGGNKSYHDITLDVVRPIETAAPKAWWVVFSIALVMFLWGLGCIVYT
ncbi:MAG: hydrogenase, partial [Schleiferiaceae bacterium]|nr:hydrogenase [Schleiferiaceae bacterium]